MAAKKKEDIKYATAQAKLSEDEALRKGYIAGTPLEGGKIADSQPVDLFSAAHNISNQQPTIADSQPVDLFAPARNISSHQNQNQNQNQSSGDQTQYQPQSKTTRGGEPNESK